MAGVVIGSVRIRTAVASRCKCPRGHDTVDGLCVPPCHVHPERLTAHKRRTRESKPPAGQQFLPSTMCANGHAGTFFRNPCMVEERRYFRGAIQSPASIKLRDIETG